MCTLDIRLGHIGRKIGEMIRGRKHEGQGYDDAIRTGRLGRGSRSMLGSNPNVQVIQVSVGVGP